MAYRHGLHRRKADPAYAGIFTGNSEQAGAAAVRPRARWRHVIGFPHVRRTITEGADSIGPKHQQSFPLFVKASATKPAAIAGSIQFERFAQPRKRGLLRRLAPGLRSARWVKRNANGCCTP